MSLYAYLLDTYGYNQPILTGEIVFREYSRPWIFKELCKLCEEGSLVRYDKGVYYIPTQTLLGRSLLDVRKVVEKKYIGTGKQTQGYYSGVALLNQLGLSAQMANTLELYTNSETANVRRVTFGGREVLLRRSRTKIDEKNVAVLRFLELMNTVSPSFFDEEKKKLVKKFIEENAITRGALTRYAPQFPDKAMRTLVESEVVYSVAP